MVVFGNKEKVNPQCAIVLTYNQRCTKITVLSRNIGRICLNGNAMSPVMMIQSFHLIEAGLLRLLSFINILSCDLNVNKVMLILKIVLL